MRPSSSYSFWSAACSSNGKAEHARKGEDWRSTPPLPLPTPGQARTFISCWLASLRPSTSASIALVALVGDDDVVAGEDLPGWPPAAATKRGALGLRTPVAEPSCCSETTAASEEELRVGVVPPRSLAAAAKAKAEEAYPVVAPVEVTPLPPPRPALPALLAPAAAPAAPAADPAGRLL